MFNWCQITNSLHQELIIKKNLNTKQKLNDWHLKYNTAYHSLVYWFFKMCIDTSTTQHNPFEKSHHRSAQTADVPSGQLNPFKQWANIRVRNSTPCKSPEQQQEIKHKKQRNKQSVSKRNAESHGKGHTRLTHKEQGRSVSKAADLTRGTFSVLTDRAIKQQKMINELGGYLFSTYSITSMPTWHTSPCL